MILKRTGQKRQAIKEPINGAWVPIPITLAGRKIKIVSEGIPCLNRIAPKSTRLTLPGKYVGKEIRIICVRVQKGV